MHQVYGSSDESPFHRAYVRPRRSEHSRGQGVALRSQIRRLSLPSWKRQKRSNALVASRESIHVSVPHIARAYERLPVDTLLDGEIAAIDKSGRISFNLLQHHRSNAQALLFYAFDVIVCQGKSLLKTPLEKRRKILGGLFKNLGDKPSPIALSETMAATPPDLIRVAKEVGFEGIVAKRRESVYEPGKCKWRVAQVPRPEKAGVCHWRIRTRQSFRFDHCWLLPRRKADVCCQGAERVRGSYPREVATKLKGWEIDTCPFANLPERKRTQWALTREEMKNCVWLRPELVAQIEFGEWTPDGHLRRSKFIGLRNDKEPREIVRET